MPMLYHHCPHGQTNLLLHNFIKNKIRLVIVSTALLTLVFVLVVLKLNVPTKSDYKSTGQMHSSHLFDSQLFTQAYKRGLNYKKLVSQKVVGGILPHHLLAAPIIAGFLDGISHQQVNTVILLSPNHYGIGPNSISTSKGTWTTLFGDLETDLVKVPKLEEAQVGFVSEGLFDTEHGIYGITPFIKKTFPDAKIVPIAIKGGTSKEDCDRLAQVYMTSQMTKQLFLLVRTFRTMCLRPRLIAMTRKV